MKEDECDGDGVEEDVERGKGGGKRTRSKGDGKRERRRMTFIIVFFILK